MNGADKVRYPRLNIGHLIIVQSGRVLSIDSALGAASFDFNLQVSEEADLII